MEKDTCKNYRFFGNNHLWRTTLRYAKKIPRFFSIYLFLPLFITSALLIYSRSSTEKQTSIINIAYPVFFTNPVKADDWSSFFVINHIYPRFFAENGYFRSNSIVKSKKVSCDESGNSILSASCQRAKVEVSIRNDVRMCNGKPFTLEHFRNEFKALTDHKNWLFPGYKECSASNGDNFCFSFKNTVNINHVLRSIYLRFGWSQEEADFKIRGVFPNCFSPEIVKDNIIYSGKISTPHYDLLLSTTESNSDIFLYGNLPDNENYQNLNYYNPIYYFLITSGDMHTFDVPWNHQKAWTEIQNSFLDFKITTRNYNADILTRGIIDSKKSENNKNLKANLKLVLPDYLSNCEEISTSLLSSLDPKRRYNLSIPCLNISSFVDNIVKVPGNKWDAYITPLTPGLPGHDALLIQYFAPTSNESWLGKNNPSKSTVSLIGTAEGMVQVKKNSFCSIKPNPLGLGDFTIDDFVLCKD